jgi:outer membrane protein insertion porin family
MSARFLPLLVIVLMTATSRAQPAPGTPKPKPKRKAPAAKPDKGGDEATTEPDSDTDRAEDQGSAKSGEPAGEKKPDVGTLPVKPSEPPTAGRFRSWGITGSLQDPEGTVLAFLGDTMRTNALLRTHEVAAIRKRLDRLGYYLSRIERKPLSSGGYQALLHLEPITLVRRVDITVNNSANPLRLREDKVFPDEVARRMQLRAGSRLRHDRIDRARQLLSEERRIADYLRNEGFFEAQVTVTEGRARRRKTRRIGCTMFPTVPCTNYRRRAGKHAVFLEVRIKKGPRYRVGKITVVGNVDIEASSIISKFHHQRGCLLGGFLRWCLFGEARFSRQQLNKDVQAITKLYQQRGFPGVRVRTDFSLLHSFKRNTRTVEFTVYISERRHISISYQGNDKRRFNDKKLDEVLTFAAEGAYDDVEVRSSAQAIRNYYQSKGHFEAVVTAERVPLVDGLERIVFYIDEGPRLPVKAVEFVGNKRISTSRLRGVVATKVGRSILGGTRGYVTASGLRSDVEKLTDLYRKEGFASAQVRARVARDKRVVGNAAALAATIAADSSANGVYVRYIIDEGRRTKVRSIELVLQGKHGHSEAELRSVLKTKPGDPWHSSVAKRAEDRLKRFFYEKGHPAAKVSTSTRALPNGDVVLIAKVSEGHEVRIGKVAIRGNFKTAAWVILGELGFKEGALMSLERVDSGQQDLRASGLFNSVQVDPVDFPEHENINVVVTVQERYDRLADVEIGAGASTDSGLFIDGGWSVPNWFGIGLGWRVRGQRGTQFSNLENKLTAPRWIARKLLGLSFRTENATFYRLEDTERFGQLESFGTSFAFSKQGRRGFLQGWVFLLRYDFRQRNREEDLVRPAGSSEDLSKAPITTRTGSVGPQVIIDKRRDAEGRRNPLAPAKGFKLELRALFADKTLGGDDRFLKVGASAQYFKQLSSRILLTNGFRYDHGIPLGGEVLLPGVERFFAGGDTTVRGFEEDRLATEVITDELPPFGDISQLRVVPAGGNIRFIYNLDLQFKIWKLLGIPVASAIFFDSGLVTNSLDRFEIGDLRFSVGASIFRWVAPFGSLSIEYAVPLDPQLGDNPRGRLHFNIGLLF